MDDKGNLLSISEVRDRLKKGEFVTVNEDANWNHKTPCTNDYYLDYYMSKNLYYLQCSDCSGFNNETYVEGKRRPVVSSRCLRRASLTINGGVLRMSRGSGLLHINDIDGRYWMLF